jgi:hypothetical protein
MNNVMFSFHEVLNQKRTDDFGTKEEISDFDINEYVQQFFEGDDEDDNEVDQIYAAHQYETEFNVKDLLKICEYYGIHKQCQKYKKMEVIYAILLYENDPTNADMVEKRKEFWRYMEELKQDKFMKRFVVW